MTEDNLPWFTSSTRCRCEAARDDVVGSAARSPQWRKLREKFLDANPACAACGVESGLEVHHLLPFHLFPEMELDPGNLMTLCGRCHLLIGHGLDWRCYNPTAVRDARRVLRLIAFRRNYR